MKPSFASSTPEKDDGASFSPEQYTISIRKEVMEGEVYFVGRVAEFPDVATYDPSPQEAYNAVISVISGLTAQLREIGKEIPLPQVVPEEFSGRVTFRMPRSLHARVDARAQLEGVSINTWLVAAAENYLGATGQVTTGMPKTLVLEGGIAGIGVRINTASFASGSETAVAVIKKAFAAANTTYVATGNMILGGPSVGAFDEPEDENPVRQHQH